MGSAIRDENAGTQKETPQHLYRGGSDHHKEESYGSRHPLQDWCIQRTLSLRRFEITCSLGIVS